MADLYKQLINRYKVYPSKELDQHFITDEKIFDKMVKEAEVGKKDRALEVGGGPGFLTSKLADIAKKVLVIEKDKRFFPALKNISGNVKLVEGDALKVRLPAFDKIVSNLPFSISGPFLSKIVTRKWEKGVLILQKEFAEKLTTKKGSPDSTHLSFLANHYLKVSIVGSVPIDDFYPAPNVEVSMVKLEKKDVKKLGKKVDKLARTLYQHKRKKAYNSLKDSAKALKLSKEAIKKTFKSRPKYIEKRVHKLTVKDFERILNRLESVKRK